MMQGVVFQDAGGRIISMNPAAERILGKSPEEFLGETSVSVEHHTVREDGSPFPGLEHPSMVALRTGQKIQNVVMGVYNPREQRYRWINISAVPLFRPGEDLPYQVYTVFEDITKRKQFEPVNLEDVFNQVVTNLKVIIEENKAQITHDPLPDVTADAPQMTQLFQNLIANAIKFRKKEEPPRVHISARRKDDVWLFSVQDNGIGIAAEFMGHLFQRGHAAGEYPGTGIGLAICKRIVERHGGRIWAESGKGKGSIFYFTIPERRGKHSESRR